MEWGLANGMQMTFGEHEKGNIKRIWNW